MDPVHVPNMRILDLIPHGYCSWYTMLSRRVHETFVGIDVRQLLV